MEEILQIKHNKVKNPTGGTQTSELLTRVAEELTRVHRDLRISSMATLPPPLPLPPNVLSINYLLRYTVVSWLDNHKPLFKIQQYCCGGQKSGNPGKKGGGVLYEKREKRGGQQVPKVARRGRNRGKLCNIA